MRTVYHPTLDVSRKVDTSAVDAWRDAGWRLKKPRHSTTSAADAADQGQHSDDEGDN